MGAVKPRLGKKNSTLAAVSSALKILKVCTALVALLVPSMCFAQQYKLPMLANSVVRDMRQNIGKAKDKALSALEEELVAATKSRDLDGVLAIKTVMQELRSGVRHTSMDISRLPSSSQTILDAMQQEVTEAERKALEALEKQMASNARSGNSEAAFQIKVQIQNIRSQTQLSTLEGNTSGAFNCDRRALDRKLRFAGGQSPTNSGWLSDRWLVADNKGQSPKALVNGDYTLIDEWHGEHLVLFVHPVSETLPGFVDFSETVKGQTGTLVIRLRNHPAGDCKATVMVDGKDLKSFDLSRDRWQTARIKIDSPNILLRVDATGWFMEHCLFTYDIVPD